MSAGGVWTAGSDSNSAARLNQKTFTIDTGTNLAAMASTYAGQPVYCTSTGGGFTADTFYIRNAANSGWNAYVPQAIHDHSANTAAAGGTLLSVMSDNTGQFIYQNELLSPQSGDFVTSVTGGTVGNDIASNQWRVKLDTATVANNFAQADLGGIKPDFGNPIKFQAKVEQQTATSSLQCRIGINVEKSNAVVGTTKLLGFEFCDATGTTYQLSSCDGTTRSVTNTTQAFNGAHSLKMTYTPSVNVIGQIDATTATTKTTNLPNSGQCDADKVMRFGIMTTNTTTKDLYIYGAVICYVPNDTWTV